MHGIDTMYIILHVIAYGFIPPPCFLCMAISSDINNKTKPKPSERLYFFVFVFFYNKSQYTKK